MSPAFGARHNDASHCAGVHLKCFNGNMRAVSALLFIPLFTLTAANSGAFFFPLSAYGITPSAIAKDAAGNTYIAGSTQSDLFPATAGALQTTFGGGTCSLDIRIGYFSGPCADVFVMKLSPDGNLIYATYLGGNGDDQVSSIATDAQGNLVLTGSTTSNLDGADTFPVTSSVLHAPGQTPMGFLAKISASGSTLIYSTLFPIQGGALALDGQGNVYVGGLVSSGFLTTPGAYESQPGSTNPSAVAKVSADGATLLYASYFNEGTIYGVAADSAGDAYVTGQAPPTAIPPLPSFPATPGALNNGTQGTFVTKLNALGTAPIYAALLGGSAFTFGQAIKVDDQGQAYVLGPVYSTFPFTAGAFETDPSAPWNTSSPAFLAKLNANGSAFVYSTYIAGGAALDIDAAGNAYVLGQGGWGFPVSAGAFQQCMNGGGNDVFLAEFSATGSLSAASYLGGSGTEQPVGIVALGAGSVIAAGITTSADFPGVAGADPGQSLLFAETLQIDNPNTPDGPCIALALQNGASFAEGPISYLEILTIRGDGIGPAQGVSQQAGPGEALPTQLGGVQVMVGSEPAPLLYVQAGQINAIAPSSVVTALLEPGSGTVPVQVQYNGASSNIATIPVSGQAPGIFPAAVFNQDGTPNSAANPAGKGSILTLYGTGGDFTVLPGVPQNPSAYWPLTPLIQIADPAPVTIEGTAAIVLYFGAAPGSLLGVIQVNVQLPPTAAGTVTLQIGGPLGQSLPVQIAFP